MSRIGKQPIAVPGGVEVDIAGSEVTVKGPKGQLSARFDRDMRIGREDDQLTVTRPTDEPRHRALHGLTRTLLANMVDGVSKGFTKTLEIEGVGYRAALKGNDLELALGYSHPVPYPAPEGISFEVPVPTRIIISGIDKQQVGQVAAEIRSKRPPEPYKGKGIRYTGEYVRRKVGKTAK
jgi:large subunit ribosomal protein L6